MEAAQTNGATRADARRNRIAVLEAAASVLAAEPDASIRMIADASGVGRTTVYRHFPTRLELLDGLWEFALERGIERSRAIVKGDPPLAEVARSLGREVLESGDYFRFLQSHRKLRERAVVASDAHAERPLVDYLQLAIQRGELRDDVPLTWVIAFAFATTLAMADQVKAGFVTPDEAVELVADAVLRSFAT